MRLAPLQLENYFIKSLRFDLRAGFDTRESLDDDVTLPKFDVTANIIQDIDDPRHCRCELHVALTDDPNDKFPYTFAITLIGMFRANKKYPDDGVGLLLKVNAPSIMYSAAREIALSISGRGNYPPVLLPSVSFANPPEDSHARQSVATKTSARKPSASKKTRSKAKNELLKS